MNQPEIPQTHRGDGRLHAPFARRPQNEFVNVFWDQGREGGADMFSDNASVQGLSYLTVSPSAVLKDIIESPFVSPNQRRQTRLPNFEQLKKPSNNVFFEPFTVGNSQDNIRLVDMFLPLKRQQNLPTNPIPNLRVPEPRRPVLQEPPQTSRSRSNSVSNCEDSGDEGSPDDKRKLTKGLKLLSVIVRDIVNDRVTTTYKEVADIILRDTINLEHLNLSSKSAIAKEEQNIKRRVYDALNVLISAGILLKDGKKVRKNDQTQKIQINLKRTDINTLHSKIVR
jgi:hypothetical protein